MLFRIVSGVLRVLKLLVAGLVAIWIVSFDPPLGQVCHFFGCKLTYSPAHWSSVLLFLFAAPLLVHEFWQIVRGKNLTLLEQPFHELTAPHTGLGEIHWDSVRFDFLHEFHPPYDYCFPGTAMKVLDCAS